MCGIVGIISKNMVVRGDVERMNEAIIHRGPDSCGSYFEEKIGLAMRRLKVVDISGGDQPVYNERKDILVFFNGEIYNYKKIRDDLIKRGHVFSTKSDTEVLVHGYEEWGMEGIVKKIEGMFAFAVYDKSQKKFFIARDRFGEKPLYYHIDNERFSFSSELKAILLNKNIQFKIDSGSLYQFLALHFVPGSKTIVENVFRLEAGHILSLEVETLSFKIVEYYVLQEKVVFDSFNEAKLKVRALLEKSIQERMVADVPVGAFLSGGVDSSIIVGMMAKHSSLLKTFSVGFEDPKFDESTFSQVVAKYFKTDHHHFKFTEKDVLNMLPEVVMTMDEPLGDQALLPLLLLAKEAKKHVTVVLGGEGADEVFGGYEYYSPFIRKDNFKDIIKGLFSNKNDFLDEALCQTVSGFPLITSRLDRLKLIKSGSVGEVNYNRTSGLINLLRNFVFIKDRLKKAQYSDIYSWLVDDLLIKYDRMGMAASLEGRAPYLDSKVVEYGFNLPKNYKWKEGTSKYILREACADLLPPDIFLRKKQGFNLPMSLWLRGILREELIKSSNLVQDDLIDNSYYKNLIDSHLSGAEDRGRLLYSLLVYKLWFKSVL